MLGRVMSVIMIFNMGLLPLSAAVSGALIRISLESVLLGAGCILIGLALVSSMVPKIRTLGLGNASDTGDNTIESVDDDIDPHT
jgi:ACR3 family arsenite efflux pump ArsB